MIHINRVAFTTVPIILLAGTFLLNLASCGTVKGYGRSGAESATFTLPEDLGRDDVVILCIGMIDSFRGDSHIDRFKAELEKILDRMPENQIVLVSPVPREVETGDDPIEASNHAVALGLYADAVRRTALEHDLLFIDLHGPLRHAHSPGGIARDGLHLDVHGWSLAEQEILWKLGMRDHPPGLYLPRIPPPQSKTIEDTLERDLCQGRADLPELPEHTNLESPLKPPPVITWDTALAHVQKIVLLNDPLEQESLRSSMDVLAGEPGRSEEALAILAGIADNESLDMDIRLAAMAAIEDLPAGLAGDRAGMQTVRISAVPIKMTYDPNRFEVTAGEPVRILLGNPDAQPHNLLVCMPGSLRSIGGASEALGTTAEAQARDWVPESPKVLHVMPMVMQGEVGEVRFIAPMRPGRYPFICTYPGHWRMMNGVMLVRSPRQ